VGTRARVGLLADRARVGTPGIPTPALKRLVRWTIGPFVRVLFRPTLTGWENLPQGRAFLLVANHSGSGLAEIGGLIIHWLDRPGGPPRLAAMAHPIAFHVPLINWILRSVGAIPSTYQHAGEALAAGIPVLVFPGGDHEVFRPIWQANRVDFAGRKGFLSLARRAWVPVVPLGIRGSHYTVPILHRSRVMPWLTVIYRLGGIKRLPVTLLLVIGLCLIGTLGPPRIGVWPSVGLGWLLMVFPLTHFFPLVPWKVRMEIGRPIEPEELFGDRDETAPLDAAYKRAEGAVQALVSPPRV